MEITDENVGKSSEKKGSQFYCQPCDKTLACHRSFRRHVKLVHKNTRIFQCKICQEEFPTGPGYFKHKRRCGVKARTMPCTVPGCTVMFASESTRLRHLNKEHEGEGPTKVEVNGESLVKCNQCDKVFKKNAGWKNHYNVAHRDPTAPKLYNCTHQGCDYASNSKINYAAHLKSHSEVKGHVCDTCGKGYNSSTHLKEHRLRVHPSDADEKLVCGVCGKIYHCHATYRKHLQSHTYVWPCSLCERTFSWESSLRSHMETTHSQTRGFACGSCASAFKLKGHLKRHCQKRGHLFRYQNREC